MINKAAWPDGEWNDEKDLEIFTTDEGLSAAIIRNSSLGHLCGYVGVPETHPLYGLGYDAAYSEIDVEVHGGLTYAGNLRASLGADPDVWYFGFDCAHMGDLVPGMLRYSDGFGDLYRSFEYVKREVCNLSRQLSAPR